MLFLSSEKGFAEAFGMDCLSATFVQIFMGAVMRHADAEFGDCSFPFGK